MTHTTAVMIMWIFYLMSITLVAIFASSMMGNLLLAGVMMMIVSGLLVLTEIPNVKQPPHN